MMRTVGQFVEQMPSECRKEGLEWEWYIGFQARRDQHWSFHDDGLEPMGLAYLVESEPGCCSYRQSVAWERAR